MRSFWNLGQLPLLAFALAICFVASTVVADYSYGYTSPSPSYTLRSTTNHHLHLHPTIMNQLHTTRNRRNMLNILHHTITSHRCLPSTTITSPLLLQSITTNHQ
uniref:Putative ovule protein n=1 Tax=Solanum chacoense TaxID=4108 RepID=A0A0V0IIS2_SOLCH